MDPLDLLKKKSALKASPLRSSLTPPYNPYAISKGESGKYPKQVSNGDLLVDVCTTML